MRFSFSVVMKLLRVKAVCLTVVAAVGCVAMEIIGILLIRLLHGRSHFAVHPVSAV